MKPILPAFLTLLCLSSSNVSADLMTIKSPGEGKTGIFDDYKTFKWRLNLAGNSIPSGQELTGVILNLNDSENWRKVSNILHLERRDLKPLITSRDPVVKEDEFQYSTAFFAVTRNTVSGKVDGFREYIANKNRIGFGFDPDHHAFNSGGSLEIAERMQSVPEPSIWKLFALSLLWIPFNRWGKKTTPPDSGKKNTMES